MSKIELTVEDVIKAMARSKDNLLKTTHLARDIGRMGEDDLQEECAYFVGHQMAYFELLYQMGVITKNEMHEQKEKLVKVFENEMNWRKE